MGGTKRARCEHQTSTKNARRRIHSNELAHVPAEIWTMVFQYLSPIDLTNVSSVCKFFHTVGNDDYLWRRMFEMKGFSKDGSSQKQWKTQFAEKFKLRIQEDLWKPEMNVSYLHPARGDVPRELYERMDFLMRELLGPISGWSIAAETKTINVFYKEILPLCQLDIESATYTRRIRGNIGKYVSHAKTYFNTRSYQSAWTNRIPISGPNAPEFKTLLKELNKFLLQKSPYMEESHLRSLILDTVEKMPPSNPANSESFQTELGRANALDYLGMTKSILSNQDYLLFQALLREFKAQRLSLGDVVLHVQELCAQDEKSEVLVGFFSFLPRRHRLQLLSNSNAISMLFNYYSE